MTTFHITYPAWMADGLCGQVGGDTWFPEKGGRSGLNEARKMCAACPVKVECLEYALEHDVASTDAHGMWGGMSAKQRIALKRQREAS